MIAIIDYGMGNLRSVLKAFQKNGVAAQVTSDPAVVARADKVVLPGVGAVADAMAGLQDRGLIDVIYNVIEQGRPFLGICLGFQLLFDQSEENGGCQSLGLIPGRVVRFQLERPFPVPHMGWNQITKTQDIPLFREVPDGSCVYFVHSYYAECENKSDVALTTNYSFSFCSAIARGNLFGTQFHPEKSQAIGLKILQNFAALES
ncbi:MAG: imidazole glycerol phosphate synthase subunit HisH [Planctomycetia bacterium]|nr:imidazole glycerol phosphate synthase subunit HisH [Planctomycetia bacterium]